MRAVRWRRPSGSRLWRRAVVALGIGLLAVALPVSVAGVAPATFGPSGAATTPALDSVVPFGQTAVGANSLRVYRRLPVVGMAALPDGAGYWMVGSDGGVLPSAMRCLGSPGRSV